MTEGISQTCPICKTWGWIGRHTCPPAWLVCDPEYDGDTIEDGQKIHALDAEQAVEKYAEERTSDGDGLFESDRLLVRLLVRLADEEGPGWTYNVTADLVPEFHAVEVK